jgi:predicted nuclease with TOPRIM domain
LENIDQSLHADVNPVNLMSMDLQFDTLNTYLHNFSNVVNQHGMMLNSLNKQVEKKSYKIDIQEGFLSLGSVVKWVPAQFKNAVETGLSGLLSEPVDYPLQASSNNAANKFNEAITAINYLYKRNVDLEARVETSEHKIKELYEKKSDIVDVDEKLGLLRKDFGVSIGKMNDKWYASLEEQRVTFRGEYDHLKRHIEDNKHHLEKKIKKCEAKIEDRCSKDWAEEKFDRLEGRLDSDLEAFNMDNQSLMRDWKKCMEDNHENLRFETDKRLKDMSILLKMVETNLGKRVFYDEWKETGKNWNSKMDD